MIYFFSPKNKFPCRLTKLNIIFINFFLHFPTSNMIKLNPSSNQNQFFHLAIKYYTLVKRKTFTQKKGTKFQNNFIKCPFLLQGVNFLCKQKLKINQVSAHNRLPREISNIYINVVRDICTKILYSLCDWSCLVVPISLYEEGGTKRKRWRRAREASWRMRFHSYNPVTKRIPRYSLRFIPSASLKTSPHRDSGAKCRSLSRCAKF